MKGIMSNHAAPSNERDEARLDLAGLDESSATAQARALSSPVRWRILRLCLHQARTNKELADLLGVNPGSMLHHVRTLVATGYLAAQEARRGSRNAVEIPYLATEQTWRAAHGVSQLNEIMLEVLQQETSGLAPDDVRVWRVGVCLDDALRDELEQRLNHLIEEFTARGEELGPQGGGPWSMMTFLHPGPEVPGC